MGDTETPTKKIKGSNHKTPPSMKHPGLTAPIPQSSPRLNHNEKIKAQMKEIFQEMIIPYKEQIAFLTKENTGLNTKILRLESYSRRNNLKFWGFAEKPGENKFDCKRNVIGMFNYANINIPVMTEVHRVGPKISGHNRAMMVTFSYIEDRDFILAKQHHIQGICNIKVEEDFPKVITEKRKELKPILIAANMKTTEGKAKYKTALIGDKLHINNKRYTVETIKDLPHELKPEQLATPTRDGMTAFFTKHSPLSNHHLAPQTIGNTTYNCNEQYLMEQKALVFGDQNLARRIMAEQDPKVQKSMAREDKFTNYSEKTWRERNIDIMETGIRAKFTQNDHLKQFLLNTKPNTLVEASPKDRYWGVGKSLHNPNLWNRNTWINNSENHLGLLLMKIRKEVDPNPTFSSQTSYKTTVL